MIVNGSRKTWVAPHLAPPRLGTFGLNSIGSCLPLPPDGNCQHVPPVGCTDCAATGHASHSPVAPGAKHTVKRREGVYPD